MHVRKPASSIPEPITDWRADAYRRFEAERTRPAADLLARVPPDARRSIVDLGCGPGNSTALLAERHPKAAIVGLDSSPNMLAAARARLPRADFRQGDIAEWSDPSAELVFANAALQWVPDHIGVMRRLAAELPARGCLAVQMPDNEDEPSHALMREIAATARFRDKLADAAAVLDATAYFDPLAWYNAPAPARPFAGEMDTPPGKLRIGLMAQAPLGIPTDDECVAAARAAAATLEELGHVVEEVEVPTISEAMIPSFIVLTVGGLADYEGVDWEAVEPHIVHQRGRGSEIGAYDYVLAARELELLSRREVARWGRDFDVLVTPTSAIVPPLAGALLEAQHAAPDQPVMDVVRSVSFTAFGNVTGLPAFSLPLHWSDSGLPIGVQLVGGPWQEASLISLAAQLEQASPWAGRTPPLAQPAG